MAAKGIFYVFIYVSDLQRSKRFYGDVLGWQLGTETPSIAGYSFGAGYLVVCSEMRDADSRRYAGGMHVDVQVDDVDAEHARLQGAGVNVSELSNQTWGERNFTFHDPDGYPWTFGQGL